MRRSLWLRALGAALVLACLAPMRASAQMTCDGANFALGINAASAAPTLVIPTTVPAGATVVAGIHDRSDETTTLTTADNVDGAWTTSSPEDSASTTMRSWTAYRVNSTGGTITVTFTFSGSISSQYIAGWCSDTGGAQTFDSAATPAQQSGGTDHDSGTVAMDGAGGIVGFVAHNNVVTFTADGAGESNIEGGAGGQRITAFFQAVSSAASHGFETTSSGATSSNFHVLGFLSPGAPGGGRGPACLLMGVCE